MNEVGHMNAMIMYATLCMVAMLRCFGQTSDGSKPGRLFIALH